MTARSQSASLGAVPWWGQRSRRERGLLVVLGLAVGGYLLMIGLIRPILAAHDEALAAIARAEAGLMQLAATAEMAETRRTLGAGQPVAAILTSTATAFSLTIRRIETEADGARVTIEDAAFADVLRWIEALEGDYGLRLDTLEMDRRPEPGQVSATLTVRR